jgi:hypothetical protein
MIACNYSYLLMYLLAMIDNAASTPLAFAAPASRA